MTACCIDRERCEACGKCAEACPSGALEVLGRTVTVDEVLAELLKDRAYYEKSGGGVTLSGGEPTFQPDFAEALLRGLKEQGISTALDTCGLCSPRTLDRLLPYTDLVLFDLKLLDPALHRRVHRRLQSADPGKPGPYPRLSAQPGAAAQPCGSAPRSSPAQPPRTKT